LADIDPQFGVMNFVKELDLKIREWSCPFCNAKHQRDVNASININIKIL
jgi:transposase